MRILIVGGGKVGYYLAKTLVAGRHQVCVVEQDEAACRNVAEQLGVMVICGDGTDILRLADAGADHADVVAAVAGHDEVNLAVCQLAKRKFQVARVIARINNPKNERVFRLLGVDATVSATTAIAALIERQVAAPALRTLYSFEGRAEVLEVKVGDGAPAAGVRLAEVAPRLPRRCVVVCALRGDEVLFTRGDTVLLPGDTVVCLAASGEEEPLERLFLGRAVRYAAGRDAPGRDAAGRDAAGKDARRADAAEADGQ